MAFCSPQYHDLDHRAVVATFWERSVRWLKSYHCNRQCFSLQLAQGEETEMTQMFSCLDVEWAKPKLRKRQGNHWISHKTWALVGQQTALRQVGKLSPVEGRWMKHLVWASLCNDRVACMKGVGNTIKAELAKGDMQEAFCLLKGWYWAASETVACPCPQMMARQTEERVELYRRWDTPGEPLPIDLQGPLIPDKVPSDHKIKDAARDLLSGRVEGASKIHAEDIKRWLRGITFEEDPKKGPNNVGEGDKWLLLVSLIQDIWMQGKTPQQ